MGREKRGARRIGSGRDSPSMNHANLAWELRADSWMQTAAVPRKDRIAILEQAELEAADLHPEYDKEQARAYVAMRIVKLFCDWTRRQLGQWLLEGRITLSEFLEYLEFSKGRKEHGN